MSNIIPNASAVEQPIERRYSSSNGWQTIRRWRGGEDAIVAQGDLMMGQGYEIIVRAGAVWELEATLGANSAGGGGVGDEPVEVWELTGNAFEKDLLQADIAAVNNLNAADFRFLRDFFDGKKNAEDYKSTSPTWVAPGSGDPEAVFQLWLAGVKSVMMYQQVLRHTKTIARGAEIPQSVTGAREIFSTTRLIAVNPVPGWIIASMPTSSTVNRPGYTGALYYGWMKAYPQITLAAFGKSQIVQEWQWGLWPSAMYTINT